MFTEYAYSTSKSIYNCTDIIKAYFLNIDRLISYFMKCLKYLIHENWRIRMFFVLRNRTKDVNGLMSNVKLKKKNKIQTTNNMNVNLIPRQRFNVFTLSFDIL